MNPSENDLITRLGETDLVVADTTKFKIKLGIGEHAYRSLTLKKTLNTILNVKGAGAVGAAVAASPTVATTFFTGSGFLTTIGLGAAAATPVGWILTAAVVSGGAYYGAMKVASKYTASRVDIVPKFINTPIDLLGATIFDLLGGLALKVADFSNGVDDSEREAIVAYFTDVWGLSEEYARRALPIIEIQVIERNLTEMARTLADFQIKNPDCNPTVMSRDIRQFLEEIAYADGEYDEREQLAIEAIVRELEANLSTSSQVMKSASHYSKALGAVAQDTSSVAFRATKTAVSKAKSFLGTFSKKTKS